MMGELINEGARAIYKARLEQGNHPKGAEPISDDQVEQYWYHVLTNSARQEYREQARVCIQTAMIRLAKIASDYK